MHSVLQKVDGCQLISTSADGDSCASLGKAPVRCQAHRQTQLLPCRVIRPDARFHPLHAQNTQYVRFQQPTHLPKCLYPASVVSIAPGGPHRDSTHGITVTGITTRPRHPRTGALYTGVKHQVYPIVPFSRAFSTRSAHRARRRGASGNDVFISAHAQTCAIIGHAKFEFHINTREAVWTHQWCRAKTSESHSTHPAPYLLPKNLRSRKSA